MDTIHDLRDLPEKGLEQFKIVDDNWDENVPGYSSFKQYSLAFLVLKSTYYSLKQRNENLSEKEAAIALVEKAEQNKTSWNYATWQMKVDLIYDMRHDGSGMFGGLSEERKEDAVIAVLESCRNSQEFKKIEERLKTPKQGTGREAVFIDDLVDFSQQDRLDYLRNIKYR
nr:hypothetical protein [uncultured Marinifilum sp.]